MPHDGVSVGELKVRGNWVISGYFKGEGGKVVDDDGWLGTGDVGTIDPDGYVQLTDRLKDVIKSGGEWISSIDIENLAVSHPDVFEAAVIAVAHPVWQERPLLIVHPRAGKKPAKSSILEFLAAQLPKWQIPDDIVFVDSLPHTATGKLLKTELRRRFHGHPDKWRDFVAGYRRELAHEPAKTAAEGLRERLRRDEPATLVYAARDEEHNNAVALKSWLERRR